MRGCVYLIDDDAAVLRGVSALLSAAGYRLAAFSSAEDFLGALPGLKSARTVILVDACMPGMQGPELQTQLKADGVDIPLIIMTAHGDIQMAVSAMRDGAVDFLEKPFTGEELTTALDRAMSLQRPVSRIADELPTDLAARMETLTPREGEVLRGIADGRSNKSIARALSVSPRTVEVHRRNIMAKMQASNYAELIRMTVVFDISD